MTTKTKTATTLTFPMVKVTRPYPAEPFFISLEEAAHQAKYAGPMEIFETLKCCHSFATRENPHTNYSLYTADDGARDAAVDLLAALKDIVATGANGYTIKKMRAAQKAIAKAEVK